MNAADLIAWDYEKPQARRHVRITEDGKRRIVVIPPEGFGDAWAGSAR